MLPIYVSNLTVLSELAGLVCRFRIIVRPWDRSSLGLVPAIVHDVVDFLHFLIIIHLTTVQQHMWITTIW